MCWTTAGDFHSVVYRRRLLGFNIGMSIASSLIPFSPLPPRSCTCALRISHLTWTPPLPLTCPLPRRSHGMPQQQQVGVRGERGCRRAILFVGLKWATYRLHLSVDSIASSVSSAVSLNSRVPPHPSPVLFHPSFPLGLRESSPSVSVCLLGSTYVSVRYPTPLLLHPVI